LQKFGPNAMPDTALHPLRMTIGIFWAPVPWMLEAANFPNLGSDQGGI
jgi:H+-transporting ATPase